MSEYPASMAPDRVARGAHDARWWRRESDGRLLCTLCPRDCRLADGQAGFCYLRQNLGGRLVTLGYGQVAALAVDPIEKKPLFHFHPGTLILSMGTAGCNMGCKFCQNWDLSRAKDTQERTRTLPPTRVPELALDQGCRSVAFTYNEPTIFAEYVVDAARECRKAGIGTVMVTNGYIGREAADEVYPWVDAANIDLKAFTDEFYWKVTASHLSPVLDAILRIREHGTWIELTTLLIPGLNDGDGELAAACDWILANLGDEVPLHYTAFHPDYRMTDRPRTPAATLHRARRLARDQGLKYVYCGNLRDEESHATACPSCGAVLVRRDGHQVIDNRLGQAGCCPCGRRIAGRFDGRDEQSRTT